MTKERAVELLKDQRDFCLHGVETFKNIKVKPKWILDCVEEAEAYQMAIDLLEKGEER